MAKKFPTHPAHPERICWGCDKYCPGHDMCCGNGSDRAQHPVELFGDDWLELLNGEVNPSEEPKDAGS
ncbi:MAG: DUF3079 domain-containing protein [Gallionella sp.]